MVVQSSYANLPLQRAKVGKVQPFDKCLGVRDKGSDLITQVSHPWRFRYDCQQHFSLENCDRNKKSGTRSQNSRYKRNRYIILCCDLFYAAFFNASSAHNMSLCRKRARNLS